jgi:hypothetical protein
MWKVTLLCIVKHHCVVEFLNAENIAPIEIQMVVDVSSQVC